MCSARLPIVGMRTTPTKKADSPNVSMNGSMAPTRISESSASRAAAASRTPIETRIDQAGPPWPSGDSWPPSVSLGFENW